jgi:hypothetical protein
VHALPGRSYSYRAHSKAAAKPGTMRVGKAVGGEAGAAGNDTVSGNRFRDICRLQPLETGLYHVLAA